MPFDTSPEEAMEIDVNRTLEFRAPLVRMLWFCGGASAAVILCIGTARPNFWQGNVTAFFSLVVALFFGIYFLIGVWRSFPSNRPKLILSPEGFLDTRIGPTFIPWTSVEKVSIWRRGFGGLLFIKVRESEWEKLPRMSMLRWTRPINYSLGADGLWIGEMELGIRLGTLFELFRGYAEAHGGKID